MTELGPLPEEWEVVRLGALFEIQQGKALSPRTRAGGRKRPFLRTANVLWGRVDLSVLDEMHFDEEEEARLALVPGDLLVCEGGDIGRTAIWEGQLPLVLYQNHLHRLRPARAGVDPLFYMYWMQAAWLFLGFYGGTGNKTTIPNLSRSRLAAFPVPLPPLPEQRAIAHILGTLDDKIELNRRMSQTLEAMARALFKSWFVDFEPVRAKMEGRWQRGQSLPGISAHLYDLFPDRLVDSELGEIPEGWRVATLDDLAEIQGGRQLPTNECQPTGVFPVFGANGIMGYTSRPTHDGFVIAFGRVGAYCGSVHWTYSGAWININASSVVPKRWPEFVLQTMLEADFEGMRTGSAQPFIPNRSLAALRVVRAPDKVMNEFCHVVRAVRLKEQATQRASRTLAALRDALLPKLISGELRVKDAERFLKERGL
jgi:type I restriction enzyme S subunit